MKYGNTKILQTYEFGTAMWPEVPTYWAGTQSCTTWGSPLIKVFISFNHVMVCQCWSDGRSDLSANVYTRPLIDNKLSGCCCVSLNLANITHIFCGQGDII